MLDAGAAGDLLDLHVALACVIGYAETGIIGVILLDSLRPSRAIGRYARFRD